MEIAEILVEKKQITKKGHQKILLVKVNKNFRERLSGGPRV